MSRKRIVLVINDLKGNGAERFVLTLADEFQRQGHHCHIVCFKRLQELNSAQTLNIHHFPLRWLRWIPRGLRGQLLAPLLDAFIRREAGGNPDLVLSNLLPVDRILCHSRLPNVHLVIHNTMSLELLNHSNPQQRAAKLQQLAGIYCRKPAVCVSKGVLADFQKLFPAHQPVTRIYNPVDAGFIRQMAAAPNPVTAGQYLVHVGKFKAAKRHDRLLRAYAQSGVKLPLVLLGQGELLESCQQLATELGIAERVIFAGFQRNPYPVIAGATAMILSSDFEGLGLVILEAIALGTPVISTDCPSGPAEILPANHLVPVHALDQLAQKMNAVSQSPLDFRLALDERFHPEVAAEQYLALSA